MIKKNDVINLKIDSGAYDENVHFVIICPDTGNKCDYCIEFLRNIVR